MQNIQDIISEVAKINTAIGAPNSVEHVAKIINSNEHSIYIAVLGQFKSGKSSLVNNIVGFDVLPVGVVPVTAIVTRIRYGSEPKLVVQFLDGRETVEPIDKLAEYVTEKRNPENIKKVALAVIEHPCMEGYKNISLVDTPGLGSLYKHNTEATQEWLPLTGVALVTVSAERPLSEEDLNLIKGITQYCPDIIIIITKTDLFSEKDLQEIKKYITESVNSYLNRNTRIFEYSSRNISSEYREKLIQEVIKPLNINADQKRNEIIKHKTISAIDQSIRYTELAIQTALKREAEKELVAKIIKDIRNNLHYHEREMLNTSSSFKSEVREKLEKIILPYIAPINDKISKQFDIDFNNWKGNLFHVSRLYEKWLNDQISEQIKIIDQQCFDNVTKIVKETAGYFQYSALHFRQRLEEKVYEIFGVHLPEAYWQIDFYGVDKPDISIYRAFDSHLDLLLFFLPVKWFQKAFYKHFYRQIPYEIEKNVQRYISELNGKILKTIDIIHQQALQYISTEIKKVEKILQQTNTNIDELKNYLDKLNQIKDYFDEALR